jgi:hypothetical protein
MIANRAAEVEAVAGVMAPTDGLAEGAAGEAAEAAAFSGPHGVNTKSCEAMYVILFFTYFLS